MCNACQQLNAPTPGEAKEIVSFCDASWGLDSVSGAILVYRGCCVKFFSRKQEVPALPQLKLKSYHC